MIVSKKNSKSPQLYDVEQHAKSAEPNPVWFKPIMVGLMVAGMLWIIVFYLTSARFPLPGIGAWNIVIGFLVILSGFLMTTRWR